MSQKEIRDAFHAYLHDYFTLRDFERTKKHFSTNITGFGSSKDEQTYTFEDFKRIFKRDIDEVPNPVNYDIKQLKITVPCEDVGLVTCEMDIDTTIDNQKLKLYGTRYTLAFIKKNGTWIIEHKHLSLPSQINDHDEPYPIKELEARTEVLQRMVEEKTTELNRTLKEVSFYASHDYMTSIPNRLKIDETLNRAIESVYEPFETFAIILMDIDNFKTINDTHGHLVGDNVLKIAANVLKTHVHSPNMVGRWGGDEFIVIMHNTQQSQAKKSAETIRKAFKKKVKDYSVDVTISLGGTLATENDTIDTLLTRCDDALYHAKALGKNTTYFS